MLPWHQALSHHSQHVQHYEGNILSGEKLLCVATVRAFPLKQFQSGTGARQSRVLCFCRCLRRKQRFRDRKANATSAMLG